MGYSLSDVARHRERLSYRSTIADKATSAVSNDAISANKRPVETSALPNIDFGKLGAERTLGKAVSSAVN